ncbi:MAG: hypothetical protein ACIPMY_03290 [Rickettsia endosymbiont of Pentastiridius leporinus]
MITNGINDNSYTVIHTTTNEPMMPVRLYYKVHNEDLLVRALKKLKCIGFENKKNFVLLYYKEAKNLDLEVYYQDVPEEFYPVILATGCIYITLRLKIVTESSIYNRFFRKAHTPNHYGNN